MKQKNMKTINKIAVLLFICIQLCSCNNEDDELQNQANLSLLINNWHTISQRIVLADGSNYKLLCDTEEFKNDSDETQQETT